LSPQNQAQPINTALSFKGFLFPSNHSPNIVSAFLINLISSQVNLIDMFFRTKLLHIAACIATAQALQISTPVSPIIKSLTTR